MRRKINVQLISISIIAIISTMLVMLFVFYDLFQTQVQDDLSANAIVLKNTGIFHSGNEKAIHMDYRELRVTWIHQMERFFMITMPMSELWITI